MAPDNLALWFKKDNLAQGHLLSCPQTKNTNMNRAEASDQVVGRRGSELIVMQMPRWTSTEFQPNYQWDISTYLQLGKV